MQLFFSIDIPTLSSQTKYQGQTPRKFYMRQAKDAVDQAIIDRINLTLSKFFRDRAGLIEQIQSQMKIKVAQADDGQ